MAAGTRRRSLKRPPDGPSWRARSALLRLWASAGDLAVRGRRKGHRAEESLPPSSRKDQLKEASVDRDSSLCLQAGKLRPERSGDCTRSLATTRPGSLVFPLPPCPGGELGPRRRASPLLGFWARVLRVPHCARLVWEQEFLLGGCDLGIPCWSCAHRRAAPRMISLCGQ